MTCEPWIRAVALALFAATGAFAQPQPPTKPAPTPTPAAEPQAPPVFRAPFAAFDWQPPAGFVRKDDPQLASRTAPALGLWTHPATNTTLMLVLCTTEDLVTAEERVPGPSISAHRALWRLLLGKRVFPEEPQARLKTPAGQWERRKLDENFLGWTLDAAPRAIGVLLQSPKQDEAPAPELARLVEQSLDSFDVAPIEAARTELVPLKVCKALKVGERTIDATLPLPPGGGLSPGSATPVYSALRFPAGHAEHLAVWLYGVRPIDALPRGEWEDTARETAKTLQFLRNIQVSTAGGPDVVIVTAEPEKTRSPYCGERYCHAVWRTGDVVFSIGWAATGEQTAASLERLALEAVRGTKVEAVAATK